MKGLFVGILLALIGYLTQSPLLILLGIVLAVLVALLNKPSKINYEYVDVKPKHIVIQAKPPKEKPLLPSELQAPFGKAIYEKEVSPIEKELKNLQVKFIAVKDKEEKKKLAKKIKKKEKELDEKMNLMAALPFGIQKKPTHPFSKIFRGIGVNLSVKLLKKFFEDED